MYVPTSCPLCPLQPLPVTPGTAKAWVMASGSIISVDAAFTDWFG
jgi:hypothetical protein